jgi:hypothetical protein
MFPYRGTDYYNLSGGPFVFPATPISFNNFYGTSPSALFTVNINVLNGNLYVAFYEGNFPVTCNLTFYVSGDMTIVAESTDLLTSTWATPVGAGAGSASWISWTILSVTGTNGSATNNSAGRLPLSTSRSIIVSKNSGGTTLYSVQYEIQIWDSAVGGTMVGSATCTLRSSRL